MCGFPASPRRALPYAGQPVTVLELGARRPATIVEVLDGGRQVIAETEDDGERRSFILRRATAVFTAATDSAWPRLVFDR